MRIFVTGGTGFVGLHVIKKLQRKKHQLLILTRQKSLHGYETVQGNMSDIYKWKKRVKQFKPEATIHLAWEGLPNYDADQSIKNLRYGLDLFLFLSEIECKKIVGVGSCWEYGLQQGKLSEDMVLLPMNAFSAAKNSLCQLGHEITRERKMNFIWTRLFYVYGPGQRKTSLIPYLVDCLNKNVSLQVKDISLLQDFVYVGDVADALVMILTKARSAAVYNIGSGKLTGTQKIIEEVAKYLKKNTVYSTGITAGSSVFKNAYADVARIKKEIGWSPKTNIVEGIRKTIAEIKKI